MCIDIYKVQYTSVTQSCPTVWEPMDCNMPGCSVLHQLLDLLKLMSIDSVMPFNHLILCYGLVILPSIFPRIRQSFPLSQFFTSGGQSIGVSSSASVLPINIQDWFPLGWTSWILLEVQGTLKSLLQHLNSKASFLQCSAFFIVQVSHPYMTTGKTIALTSQTFVGKVMSLLLICCLVWS